MSNRQQVPGKFVWFELACRDAKRAQSFYGEVLGWRVVPFPMGNSTYEMIYAGDTMVGGYAPPPGDHGRPQWISYVSVEDVDLAVKAALANGGTVVAAPVDIPSVGRRARIADAQGAELGLFKSASGDPADELATQGRWFWDELHTTDTASALSFYEKVVGFTHRSMDMGPAGTYHIVSKGGVERGGVTSHLAPGVPPHWLPYVYVDEVDKTVARAKKLGGEVVFGPEDIPGIGRLGGLADPTGGVLAVMKPLPREKSS